MSNRSKTWSGLFVAMLLAACGAEQQIAADAVADDPLRLAANVVPIAQQIKLNIDPDQDGYTGATTITIENASETA